LQKINESFITYYVDKWKDKNAKPLEVLSYGTAYREKTKEAVEATLKKYRYYLLNVPE
jgi:hypothetical protein